MKNQKNEEQILSSLSNITECFEKSIHEFLEHFDIGTAYTFSDEDQLKKQYLRIYKKFNIILKMHIEKYESEISRISEIVCDADNSCNKERTESLVKHFDSYMAFSVSVSHFIKNCDTVFLDKEKRFSPHVIENFARKLLVATQNYKENI